MSEPLKMVLDDGQELSMTRCSMCKCPMIVGYKCMGCEAMLWKDVYLKLRDIICEGLKISRELIP